MTDPTHNEPAGRLADQWLATKEKIQQLQKQLAGIEAELIQFCETTPEGSRTTELPSGHKVTVKCGFNRRMDWDTWNTIKDQIPPKLRPVKVTETLDVQGLRYLANNEPETYQVIAKALTVTPSKPYFGVRAPAPTEVL